MSEAPNCPDWLQVQPKAVLAQYLVRQESRLRRVGADQSAPDSAKLRGLRRREDARVDFRLKALRQVIVEYAQSCRRIMPGDYVEVARRVSEITGAKMHPSTLYNDPYRVALVSGNVADWQSAEMKRYRALRREKRSYLVRMISRTARLLKEAERDRIATAFAVPIQLPQELLDAAAGRPGNVK